jgi:phytoene dehydrogenase-like protein
MAALRLARAYTKRSGYVLLEGGYHGLFDAALWTLGMDGWDPTKTDAEPQVVPYSQGVPEVLRQLLHVAPMNDANHLEDLFKRKGHEIAAMLMEPIQGNCCGITADVEYVRAVRELCDRYGVVLIIDEVKSGFRVARGGIQEVMGVKADLCTFAKAMANGYPIAAIGGREEIMRMYGNGVAHGGTYTGHCVSLAAAEKTLEIIEETPALETIAAYGKRMQEGMSRVLKARGIAHSFAGHPSMAGCSSRRSRRRPTATGSPRTTPSTMRWPSTCTTRACSASRTPRALVRLRGPRRRLPEGHAEGLRDRGRPHDRRARQQGRQGGGELSLSASTTQTLPFHVEEGHHANPPLHFAASTTQTLPPCGEVAGEAGRRGGRRGSGAKRLSLFLLRRLRLFPAVECVAPPPPCPPPQGGGLRRVLIVPHCPLPTAHCPLPTAHCPLPLSPSPDPPAMTPPPSTAGKVWDAIVVGAGHNGLVNACYLARAGLDVLVVERNDWVGGAATSRSLYPGFLYSNCSYVCSLLRPEIMRDLELPKHGLQVVPYEGGVILKQDGGYLGTFRDHDAHRREIGRHSLRDAEAYDRYSAEVIRQCRFIRPFLLRTPPDPTSLKPRDVQELLYLGRKFYDLTETEMADTVRFWTMSIAEFLDEFFETDVVKAGFCISGIIGTALGPLSPGTAYVLLHHYMGDVDGAIGAWGFARGGMGAISESLASSFRASGGTVRTGASVDKVLVENGRAAGVVLDGGEEIRGRLVVSNLDVKRTFLKLVEEPQLPADFVRKVKNFKIRGSSGKVNIALDGLPDFPALPPSAPFLRGDMHFTDSVERMEGAYDDWKAGRWSADPFLDMMIPTTIDPTMAPPASTS